MWVTDVYIPQENLQCTNFGQFDTEVVTFEMYALLKIQTDQNM